MTTKKNAALAVPSILGDPDQFEHAQRVGKMIALSPLFPEHLRKGGADVAMANAVLVQDMAARLSRPPMEIAQNIYFVSGKPGWSTSFLISLANESGKLKKPINWEITGAGDNLSVKAFVELQSGAKAEYTVTMAMAKAENWTKNPKYKTMPKLMLRYRSAAGLIRLYMPEITMGYPVKEEVLDGPTMRDITPQTSSAPADTGEIVSETVDGEVMPPEDAPKAKAKAKAETKPEVADEDKPSAEDVERHVQLTEMIISEIDACESADMLDEVLGMYKPQIDQLNTFDKGLGDKIDAKVTERRAQLTDKPEDAGPHE